MTADTISEVVYAENLRPLQADLITLLEEKGGLNRTQIVTELLIPRTTAYDNLAELIELGLVEKTSKQINNRGRPVIFFQRTKKPLIY
ncbi:MAG: hypothetical protein GF353_28750 [Candidatus Lokiarchaeota archaeon]|nr:hypothetical protein [Candidatus Lokiarchaeota archaeon]MBD3353992.1 hypothetical protein [Candidatus Lokiarchaeota archaeon]